MTYIIQIDIISAIIGILIIPTIVFLCGIAIISTNRLNTFVMGSYVENTVQRNNELIKENQRLRKKLKGE